MGLNPAVKDHKKVIEARRTLKKLTGEQVQELARNAAKAAIKALEGIVNNPVSTDQAKIAASQTLLDRGYGRPTQTNINASVNTDGKPSEIDEQELSRRVKETVTRIEALTKRKREKIEGEERPTDIRKFN